MDDCAEGLENMAERSRCSRDAACASKYDRTKVVEAAEHPHRGGVGMPVVVGDPRRQKVEFVFEVNILVLKRRIYTLACLPPVLPSVWQVPKVS